MVKPVFGFPCEMKARKITVCFISKYCTRFN